MNGSGTDIDVDESDNCTDSSNDIEDKNDEGVFDDADDDGGKRTTTTVEVDVEDNRNQRKRKIKFVPNTFFNLRRAMKRRRRRQESDR